MTWKNKNSYAHKVNIRRKENIKLLGTQDVIWKNEVRDLRENMIHIETKSKKKCFLLCQCRKINEKI